MADAMEAENVPESRRGWRASAARCALVLSVCALLVSLAALALILALRLGRPPPHARLVHKEPVKIQNGRLKWYTSPNTQGVNFDQEFHYETDSDRLKIKSEGVYCIYAQMAIHRTLTDTTEQGNVTLIIHKTANNFDTNSDRILTLSIHLYPKSNETLSSSMAVVFPLQENNLLHVTLTASPNSDLTDFKHWELTNPTIFSVSRISGNSK